MHSRQATPVGSEQPTPSASQQPSPTNPCRCRTIRNTWTVRDVCLAFVAKRFPGYNPEDDLSLMLLGMYNYQGDPDPVNLSAWLAEERHKVESSFDSRKTLDEHVKKLLSGSLQHATGVSPCPF